MHLNARVGYYGLGDNFIRNLSEYHIPASEGKILIAEDYELNQALVKKLLGRMGFKHYDVMENGILTVEAFGKEKYDLVLMDCHMTKMNGYQATAAIRKLEKETETHVPIVALTADAMVGTREKCFDAGVDAYISKPIDADQFRALLSRWFILSREVVSIDGEVNETGEGAIIDLSNLNDYADTKEELVMFCQQLCTSTEDEIKILKDQCTEGQNEAWVETVHKIKGTAGLAGAFRLHFLVQEAQKLEKATVEERKKYYDNICLAYQDVKDALSKKLEESL